jgi:IMP dehydrogenase
MERPRMKDRIEGEGLAFDDVLLIPQRSEVLPSEVDTRTRLTRNIDLNIPIISAAMDTVSEARLAIAMAREGGIGIIHKNLPVKEQAAHVDRVKRSESGMILKPITLRPDATVQQALNLMMQFRISGVPITNDDGKLVGILTNRDLRFLDKTDALIETIMTAENLVTVPEGTTLEEARQVLHSHRIEKLPVVDGDFMLKGLITVKDIKKKAKYPNACKDEKGRLRVGAAVGVSADTRQRVEALIGAGVDVIVVDSAHGHSAGIIKAIGEIKAAHPGADIIAGNIVSADAVRELADAGADAIKVGIGPGSICTTRVVAGVGVPQVTAIMKCREACDDLGLPLVADGGIKYSGDIVKAIAAGAHSVMVGSLFAGTEESPGETVLLEGRSYKVYRAMGSISAMKAGSGDRYFQENVEARKLVPEGIEGRVPYRGPLSQTVFQLVGGLRSGMGYCGAGDIETMRNRARFIKITHAGLVESHPHDVTITKEAPNYRPPGSG